MSYKESLCYICANAVPQLCPWIGKGDRTELVYQARMAEYRDNRTVNKFRVNEIVTVIECPRFREGALPSLGKTV